jgi:anti-anti-sigma factor
MSDAAGAARAALEGELRFSTVLAHRTALAPQVESGSGPFTLDLSGVRSADSAGLSLLLELTRLARAHGRELRVVGAPPQLRRLANFFELGELLSLAA